MSIPAGNISTYGEYIQHLKKKYIGRNVEIRGKVYQIVDIDYNGSAMINMPNFFTDTTAVPLHWVIKED